MDGQVDMWGAQAIEFVVFEAMKGQVYGGVMGLEASQEEIIAVDFITVLGTVPVVEQDQPGERREPMRGSKRWVTQLTPAPQGVQVQDIIHLIYHSL